MRRRLLHDRVAQTLLRVYDGDLDSISGQLAEHFLQAGRKQEAIDYLIRAGDRSVDQYANEEALNFLARALALLPENELERRYAILVEGWTSMTRRQDVLHRLDELDAVEDVINRLDDGDRETTAPPGESVDATLTVRLSGRTGAGVDTIWRAGHATSCRSTRSGRGLALARLAISFAYWAAGDMQKVRDLFREPLEWAKQQGRLDIAAEIMSRLGCYRHVFRHAGDRDPRATLSNSSPSTSASATWWDRLTATTN